MGKQATFTNSWFEIQDIEEFETLVIYNVAMVKLFEVSLPLRK